MVSKYRRAGCVFLAWVMAASLGASTVLALANDNGATGAAVNSGILDTVTFEDVTGKVNLTSVALQNMSPSVFENAGFTTQDENRTVIVTLDGDCIMDGVSNGQTAAEYLASYAGGKKLKSIMTGQTNFLNSLASLGVSYKVKYQYSTATNAVAIEVNTSNLSKIKSIASVKSAVVSETYLYPEETVETTVPEGTENPSNIYATGIYDSSKYVAQGLDGSGMTVAVLDTGLDYTHEAFSTMPTGTLGLTKSQLSSKLSANSFKAVELSEANGKTITADDLYVNDKVPFAYDYADKDTDVYPSYSQHGVHVAGIVAGHADSYKNKDGEIEYEKDANGNYVLDGGEKIPVEFNGVAPNAQLVICKVFTDNLDSKDLGGAVSEDILAALDDCVALGVDVINMSLGTTAGFSLKHIDGDSEGDEFIRVYSNIKKAGISLICAASNDFSSGYGSAFGTNLASNPDSGTIGSPSTFTGALSVASINGQYSPFMYANGQTVVYYSDASNENAVKLDFAELMLEGAQSKTFKYVLVGNAGQASGYTSAVRKAIEDAKEAGEKIIALVQRGTNTFKDKVEIAQRMGASAVIIYNNVAGTIGVSIGDIDDPIPTASITMDAGNALRTEAGSTTGSVGYIEINRSYQAGPFMNDYSSWGTTPDLKIKPEITSHGGEITSAVSGGWAEMSGTSMASPNMAGFVTLLRGYLKDRFPDYNSVELAQLVNQIVMSTAVTVYDQEGLPYSPRKQGAGLGTLDNVFSTKAYLMTDEEADPLGAEDNRPKIELGDDKTRTGVYDNMIFYVVNFGTDALTFKADTIFMTETLSSDGLSVAEKAHLLTDIPAEWTVGGKALGADGIITVQPGEKLEIKVKLTLSDAEKKYIDDRFVNGMFVEGFLRLISQDTTKQCSLTLPFMGFYGDWTAAPMLDYDAFQISQFKQDSSYDDETRPQEQVWATQPYATYYHNEKYTVPMGSFVYLQDEFADQIYATEEYCAISCYDVYGGEDSVSNYLTTTSIKALYTGLLRNAELVTYDLYNAETGELILSNRDYRVSKAYSSAGSAVPANVEVKIYPDELGLVNNGKYELKFHFYFKSEDAENPDKQNDDNTFAMSFYVDYEAPVLQEARLRYYDYKENNRDKQRVYLDLDIYDNHYAQAVVLCYTDTEGDITTLNLATEYITPVYNAVKNGTTTVSIEITDIYKDYQNKLYCEIDDYALNHSVYRLFFSSSNSSAAGGMYDTFNSTLPDTFEVDGPDDITIGLNETYKVALSYEGTANLSNFKWESSSLRVAQVNGGEIFGAAVGTSTITITADNGVNKTQRKITVHVVQSSTTLTLPSISFGVIKNSSSNLVKASGTVKVNAGEDFTLEVLADPWYYPVNNLTLRWSSSDEEIATVDQSGNVSTMEKKGTALIKATIMNGETATSYSANVTLSVQEPFTVTSNTLTAYHGRGGDNGVVTIPNDKNIIAIGERAFEDNDNVRVLIIPKTVTQIAERAFLNCTALEEVYFIDVEAQPVPDSAIALIARYAFEGCTALKKVDLTNVKKVTLGEGVFSSQSLFIPVTDGETIKRYSACTALEEIVGMDKIGTMNSFAFAGCTSLEEADLTGTFDSGIGVFYGCTGLKTVKTDYYSSIGESMFYGCTGLESVTINAAAVSDYAFQDCGALKTVVFGGSGASNLLTAFTIGEGAFYDCKKLEKVTFGDGYKVTSVGNLAFANCILLSEADIPAGAVIGIRAFENTLIDITDDIEGGAYYSGTILVSAPHTITSDFAIRAGTTEIAAYAFANCTFENGVTLVIPDTVTTIGARAFGNSTIKSVILPASLKQIPDYAFSLTSLESIAIPAGVTRIGEGAFLNCRQLASVSFGTRGEALVLGDGVFYGCSSLTEISLPELAGNAVPYRTFYNCASLESVNLGNATQIGDEVFANCVSLGTVTGLDKVTVIGDGAFMDCSALTALNLASAKSIGALAFCMTDGGHYTSLSIPAVVTIGNNAFYGCSVTTVTLPASLETLGYGAFANSKLTAINVSGNKFFTEDGAVYRIISGNSQNGTYELASYPSSRVVTTSGKVYNVKEGTVLIGAEAFRELASGAITEIVLPYSVNTIGAGAFYGSGITSFVFNSITAPVLQSDYFESDFTFYTLYYANFETEIQNYISGATTSRLKISYPTNGEGYDNYVYSRYFATKTLLGELMSDETRALKNAIEGFVSASEVKTWVNLPDTAENYQMVNEFSESVKAAHALYLQITGETQLGFLGEENVNKLFEIEEELKAVKAHFNITVKVTSVALSPDSTHKTEYKVGDKFDMTGLKLIVTYDDYSTELADMSKVSFASGYDRELATYDNQVVLTYEGRAVYIQISVTEEGEEIVTPEPAKKKGCGATSFVDGGGISGFIALGLTACALAAVVTLKRKKV